MTLDEHNHLARLRLYWRRTRKRLLAGDRIGALPFVAEFNTISQRLYNTILEERRNDERNGKNDK